MPSRDRGARVAVHRAGDSSRPRRNGWHDNHRSRSRPLRFRTVMVSPSKAKSPRTPSTFSIAYRSGPLSRRASPPGRCCRRAAARKLTPRRKSTAPLGQVRRPDHAAPDAAQLWGREALHFRRDGALSNPAARFALSEISASADIALQLQVPSANASTQPDTAHAVP